MCRLRVFRVWFIDPKDGGSRFLRYFGAYLTGYVPLLYRMFATLLSSKLGYCRGVYLII